MGLWNLGNVVALVSLLCFWASTYRRTVALFVPADQVANFQPIGATGSSVLTQDRHRDLLTCAVHFPHVGRSDSVFQAELDDFEDLIRNGRAKVCGQRSSSFAPEVLMMGDMDVIPIRASPDAQGVVPQRLSCDLAVTMVGEFAQPRVSPPYKERWPHAVGLFSSSRGSFATTNVAVGPTRLGWGWDDALGQGLSLVVYSPGLELDTCFVAVQFAGG